MSSSLAGFFFSVVDESMLKMLKVTEETLKIGDQSVSKISKQTNPFEKT